MVTYRHQSKKAPEWRSVEDLRSDLAVSNSETIENDTYGTLQIDLADNYIGGRILASAVSRFVYYLKYSDGLRLSRSDEQLLSSVRTRFACSAEHFEQTVSVIVEFL